jgi:7-cyano-7-deazaguanine synthase in queuosine biosynthesis
MPEPATHVRIGEEGGGRDPEIIRINGTKPTFRIDVEGAEKRMAWPTDDLLLDLVGVAGSVYAADRRISRGTDKRSDFGAAWRRKLHFEIPVRRLEVWQRPAVVDALTELVAFLTDDIVSFEFRSDEGGLGRSQYGSLFDRDALHGKFDTVILLSGGLDSLAGAMETLKNTDQRVALVTHVSAQKILPHQLLIARKIVELFPGRVLHVPIRATAANHSPAKGETQRSRTLLFSALAYLVATSLEAGRIRLFENGVISLNLPFSRQIVGTMATRTTHPRTLELMRRFLGALGNSAVRLDNPYAWLTKTEVLQRLVQADGVGLIEHSISCTSVRDRDRLHTHCGACSQCLDRRFAIVAAGLEQHEYDGMYETDVLLGPRASELSQTTALEWTRHAINFEKSDAAGLATKHAGELQRVIKGNPGVSASEVVARVDSLLQRQGQQVATVLERTQVAQAAAITLGELQRSSLLAMFVSAQTGMVVKELGPRPSRALNGALVEPGADDGGEIFPLKVRFATDGRRSLVEIRNLTTLSGSHADVPHALLPTYREDRMNNLPSEQHRFTHEQDVQIGRTVGDGTVRQKVSRCRDELNTAYRDIMQEAPPRALLIETRKSHGYRLDPTIEELP